MKTFVMIPTYNEKANIGRLIPAILKKTPGVKILVVDDNSPDGTAGQVLRLKKKYPRKVFLLRRTAGRGRGTAGIAGLKYALDKKADVIVEMDADFSHHPKYLPLMLKEIKKHDIVLGSRFVKNGEDRRGLSRHLITVLGNLYIRSVLKLSIKDCTSGYRAFKKKALKAINLDSLISSGPSIVQEILYKADLLGFDIKEIPIVFIDRRQGKSKFNFKIMLQGILMVLVLRLFFTNIWKESSSKK